MKNLIVGLFLFGSFLALGQTSLNEYKYIIVPKKFDGFRNENQYQTSTIIKYLLTEKGYNVVYDDALPNDLNTNRCLGLTVALDDQSSMFSTKAIVHLKDCNGAIVMTTVEGKSKSKEYKTAYSEAIKEALKSFDMINYSYQPKQEENDTVTLNFKNDVKKMEGEKSEPKNRPKKEVVQEASTTRQTYEDKTPVNSDFRKGQETAKKTVEEVVTSEEQSYKDYEPVASEITKAANTDVRFSSKKAEGILYAQELPNGYQLVDSTPKIKLTIHNTSMKDYYLAKSENQNGVVYLNNEKWFFEYYEDGTLIVEELNIRF